jgi:hypothetical protein
MAREVQLELVCTTPVETGGNEMCMVFNRLRIAMMHGPPG